MSKGELEQRITQLKSRASFRSVVALLRLRTDKGVMSPCCGGRGLRECRGGQGFWCDVCESKGDMINLVCLARDCGAAKAVKFLEEHLPGERDGGTRELFE